MCLQIKEIPSEGLRLERSFDLREATTDHDGRLFPEALAFVGRIRPESGRFSLQGSLSGTARLACSRCLECYDERISGEFRLVVRADGPAAVAGVRQMDPADAISVRAVDGKLDLGELIREQAHLLLPLKPLCRRDCLGLCPTCGADRNRIECGCSGFQVDPRLAGLAEIRRKMPRIGNINRPPNPEETPGPVGRGDKNDGESEA